jgi:hypothetical protein
MSTLTLIDILADLTDPRGRHGVRHPLDAIFGLGVFGGLTGRRSLAAIARLGATTALLWPM